MRKRLLVCLMLLTTSFAFSKSFFDSRIFEVKVNAPVNISNNTFNIFEFLKKEVVIDLRKIADEMPQNGFNLSLLATPNSAVTLNFGEHVKVGPRMGIEASGAVNVSKSFFDFLGYGNKPNEDINVNANVSFDVFAYTGFLIGLKFKKLKIGIEPHIFIPIVSGSANGLSFSVLNQNGKIQLKGSGGGFLYENLPIINNEEDVDTDKMISTFLDGRGIDLGGYIGYDVSKSLSFTVNYEVPIIPGKFFAVRTAEMNIDAEISAEKNETEEGSENSGENNSALDFSKAFTFGDRVSVEKEIHRPLKLNLGIDYTLVNNFIYLNGLIGVGVRHPFMDDAQVYPEYAAGLKLTLAGFVSLQVSTDYFDQVFSHTLAASMSLRFVQVDAGVKFSSTDFVKSFSGSGIGAFATVYVGF